MPAHENHGWSFQLTRIAGIDVRVHATFFMLLAWIGLSHLVAGHGLAAAASGALSLIAVFAIVVLHELGHALTARRFGIKTRDITLLPIGGVATLEKMPDKPGQELLVALAGPAVNVVLALLAFVAIRALGLPLEMSHVHDPTGDNLVTQLFWVNITLAVFNLIPAFPMDGGRVLRAALAARMERARATQIAASIGRFLAVILGVAGLFANPLLVLAALFVWSGAGAEAGAETQRAHLRNRRVRDATITRLVTLAPDDPIERAVELTLSGTQNDFPVVDNQRPIGILTQSAIVRALASGRRGVTVRSAMDDDVIVAAPSDPLDSVLDAVRAGTPILVGSDGKLDGMLTAENLGELLLFSAAGQAIDGATTTP